MALSDDQRALLRLLARREEGYEDIAALKGLGVEEVRAEVAKALAELEASGEAPPPPAPAAEEPELPEATPEPLPPESAKEAEPVVAARPTPTPAAAQPAPAKPSARRPALPAERRRLLLLTGGALGIVAVVLIAIAVFGGDSDSGSNSAASESSTETAAAESGKVTQAVLAPADGSDASGRAVFGRVGKEEIVLQVTAENLQPTDSGQTYTVWLYRSPKLSLRVGSVPVGEAGSLGARFTIPAELLAYVASGAFDQIHVSRTSNAAYQQEVAAAKRNKTLPRYIGETVLTGEITGPIAKAAGAGG